jgi:BirA family transcriptional regulator, biotin operon repressor / biotin---[acetyl-CoA-carboxylase] ligase
MAANRRAARGLWGGRLWAFAALPSTNGWALANLARLGHGDVVWAARQTAGRGRLGRAWLAPAGKCLTLSVVLRDAELAAQAPNLGQAAAWAVREVLERHGVPAVLKWPNDVLAGDGKIAGILAERGGDPDALVLGIGLNVSLTRRDVAAMRVDRPATSLAIVTGRRAGLAALRRRLLDELEARLDEVRRGGLDPLLGAWARHDALAGRDVEVRGAAGVLRGRCEGLDAAGRLCVRDAAGTVHALWTGDAERVRPVVDFHGSDA